MPGLPAKDYPPRQSPLLRDQDPPLDLARAPNDADDQSDAGMPTTCHQATGWRKESPAKP
jgi:hypothetical protein